MAKSKQPEPARNVNGENPRELPPPARTDDLEDHFEVKFVTTQMFRAFLDNTLKDHLQGKLTSNMACDLASHRALQTIAGINIRPSRASATLAHKLAVLTLEFRHQLTLDPHTGEESFVPQPGDLFMIPQPAPGGAADDLLGNRLGLPPIEDRLRNYTRADAALGEAALRRAAAIQQQDYAEKAAAASDNRPEPSFKQTAIHTCGGPDCIDDGHDAENTDG